MHRAAGVIPSATATQKIPIVEKPRNFLQASEDAEAVLADTEIFVAEHPHNQPPGGSKLSNLNPVLQS